MELKPRVAGVENKPIRFEDSIPTQTADSQVPKNIELQYVAFFNIASIAAAEKRPLSY